MRVKKRDPNPNMVGGPLSVYELDARPLLWLDLPRVNVSTSRLSDHFSPQEIDEVRLADPDHYFFRTPDKGYIEVLYRPEERLTIDDVVRRKAGRHIGSVPSVVHEVIGKPPLVDYAIKLRRIPNKITAYFDRDKIAEVFRGSGGEIQRYYLRLIDCSYLEVEY